MCCRNSRCTESIDNPVSVVHDARVLHKYNKPEGSSSEDGDDNLYYPVDTDKHSCC